MQRLGVICSSILRHIAFPSVNFLQNCTQAEKSTALQAGRQQCPHRAERMEGVYAGILLVLLVGKGSCIHLGLGLQEPVQHLCVTK